ncbi:MAG TPA: FAD-dependent oxidoreductase, partial [Kineosporiaceae bacterium]|nr:FAD-dependent oxidoreductase [Kineosporiaceae bacterium]
MSTNAGGTPGREDAGLPGDGDVDMDVDRHVDMDVDMDVDMAVDMAVDMDVDVVVLGAGPPGENVAGRVRAGGLSCVVVDSELFGGECSYWACVPSKALLRPVEARDAATRLPGIGVGRLDARAVLERRDRFTGFDGRHHDDTGQVQWIESTGARALRGHARLTGERRLEVERPDGGGVTLTARHAVVLAVGSDAALPPVPGLAEATPWTSREATSSERVPQRLAVLGGGVV